MTESRIYRGIDLLEKVLEFVAMTPDSKDWHLLALKSNKPRYIRLQQITSLIAAFFEQDQNEGLFGKLKFMLNSKKNISIQTIISGEFIKENKTSDYEKVIDLIFQRLDFSNEFQKSEVRIYQLANVYRRLLNYKQQLTALLEFNSGVLEASFIPYFSVFLTDKISSNLVGKYDELGIALELLINPKGLSFTEEELKVKYKFPTANLDSIDMDFL